jgi:hypothetical protein
MYCRAHSLVNGSSLKKGVSVDSLLEKIPVNMDSRVSTTGYGIHIKYRVLVMGNVTVNF